MRTKHVPFQLDDTIPGAVLVQGFAGGMLAGLIYLSAIAYGRAAIPFVVLAAAMPIVMLGGGMIGIIKATLIYAFYRFTGSKLSAAARVFISSVVTLVLAVMLGLQIGFTNENQFLFWVALVVVSGLPTALLVGSGMKPWRLVTFDGIEGDLWKTRLQRIGAKLGALPLRLLSIISLLLFLLGIPFLWEGSDKPLSIFVAALLPPVLYLAVSAYLTFKSPSKLVLLGIGLALNTPLVQLNFFVWRRNQPLDDQLLPAQYWIGGHALDGGIFCKTFVLAWAVFLIVRLTMRFRKFSPLPALLARPNTETGHQCLGSRFHEWHDRFA